MCCCELTCWTLLGVQVCTSPVPCGCVALPWYQCICTLGLASPRPCCHTPPSNLWAGLWLQQR